MVVCLHNNDLPEALTNALPEGFAEKRFVAKFENGKLAELRAGEPEDLIKAMLAPASESKPAAPRESRRDQAPEDGEPAATPRQ